MKLEILVNSTPYSDAALADKTRISKELSGRVSTAQVSFFAGREAVYDEAVYDEAAYGVDAAELSEIVLKDADTGVVQFAGYISRTKRAQLGDESGEYTQIDCDCNDWTIILEQTVVPMATFSGQTDRAIVQSLIGTYAPKLTALTANIASTTTLTYWEVKDKTLRQALDELRELTACEYYIDYDKNLHWFTEGTFAAPFGLTTEVSPGEYRVDDYTRDSIKPINRCIVLGGLIGTTEIKVQYDDPVSQSIYGVYEWVITDREITNANDALLRAQAMVQEFAYPIESGSLVTWRDGLDIGQSIPLYHRQFALDGTYLIRSLEMSWEDATTTQYSIEFGKPKPKLDRLIRVLEAQSRASTQVPTAIPVTGSVTDASIAPGGLTAGVIGTVNANSIVGLIQAGQIDTINATQISGTIQAAQIGTVNAGTIQGVITAGQIGSVNATTIQGVIISSQVADDLIDRLSMYSNALRPIPRLAADPTLPNASYPTNSVIYNTTLAVFRRNNAGTWQTVTESTAVTGKLEYWHVGTIKAGSIIGLIAAGQIDTITASQITGQVSASQILSVNASAIVGGITASQITTVNASAIQGSITSSQIASVSASTITGTINSSQISSVSASSITGTITAGQIGSINAATITIGQVGNSQISGMSAGKLTAGTIDASVITVTNLNASNITTGLLSATRLTSGTITIGTTTIDVAVSGFTITSPNPLGPGTVQSLLGGTGLSAPNITVANVLYAGAVSAIGGSGHINISGNYYRNGVAGITGSIPATATLSVAGGIIVGYA